MNQKKRIKVGDHFVDVRSHVRGDRQAVIMVHGIGVSGTYFIPLAQKLSQIYDVFVIDLPGYGKTPKPARALDIYELSKVVTEFVKSQKIYQPVVIGQSMGCQIVVHAVKDNPSLFRTSILIGPTVNPRERTLPMQFFRLLQDTLSEPLRVNGIIFMDYLRMGMGRYIKTAQYMTRDHTEDIIGACNIPTLIMRGGRDPIVPRDWCETLASIAPLADFIEIQHAPHNVHFVAAHEVALACREFIGR